MEDPCGESAEEILLSKVSSPEEEKSYAKIELDPITERLGMSLRTGLGRQRLRWSGWL
jgi:hypothetical protein